MRILILGGSGMVGHRLWMNLRHHHETWATLRSLKVLEDYPILGESPYYQPVDVRDFNDVEQAFSFIKPDLVINCVGLIKQLDESKDPLVSIELNSVFPHKLARLCSSAGIRMIQLSTDCVFSGSKGNYIETDVADGTDLYGRTKFLGEVDYPNTITLRTSFIGRELRGKLSLVEWFFRQESVVRGFQMAIYSGLTTDEFSKVILDYIIPNVDMFGVYHVSSQPISKYELLKLINEAYGLNKEIIPHSDFVCDRSLDSTRLYQSTGYSAPPWPKMIQEMAANSALYDE